jgi:pyridoxine kinase
VINGSYSTFAAATTAYLANGKSPKEAVIAAKAFVASAIKNGWKMNDFVGPVDHGANPEATKALAAMTASFGDLPFAR